MPLAVTVLFWRLMLALLPLLVQTGDAVPFLRSARALSRGGAPLGPGDPLVLEGLARILATHPDPALRQRSEAVVLAERAACTVSYRHPVGLDTLVAAYAATGDFETAQNVACRAITIAQAGGASWPHPLRSGWLSTSGIAFVPVPP